MQRFGQLNHQKAVFLRIALGLCLLAYWQDLVRDFGFFCFDSPVPVWNLILPSALASGPAAVTLQLAGVCGAVLLIAGRGARFGALLCWIWLAWLSAGNHFLYEVQFDYLGWMLIGFALFHARGDSRLLERLALWVMGISYSAAGVVKTSSSFWNSGDTFRNLELTARSTELSLAFPWMTPLVSILQLFALPLLAFRRTAPWAWLSLSMMQLGMLIGYRIERITIPMLLFHFLAFQQEWQDWIVARSGRRTVEAGTDQLLR